MTKTQQTKKNRTPNPKKMSKTEYMLYVDFVFDLADYACQCGCGKAANEIHHGRHGAGGRDDRTITAINNSCHFEIHHGTDIDIASKKKLKMREVGDANWVEYLEIW